MSIANVSIVGNLVKAPQQVQFESGKIKTTMMVAVNTPGREKRGGEKADFYMVETWGKLAEMVSMRLDKGNQVTAHGRLLMSKWKDTNGMERVTPTISALDVAFPQRLKAAGEGQTSRSSYVSSPPVSNVTSISTAPSMVSSPNFTSLASVRPSITPQVYEQPLDTAPREPVPEQAPEQPTSASSEDQDEGEEYTDEEYEEESEFGLPDSKQKAVPNRKGRSAPG